MPFFPESPVRRARLIAGATGIVGAALFGCGAASDFSVFSVLAILAAALAVGTAAWVLVTTTPHYLALEPWRRATSWQQLCDLTVEWLHGRVAESPSSLGPPDPETELIREPLTVLNRAGLLTLQSQPQAKGLGWEQRATVTLLCGPAHRALLRALAMQHDLLFFQHFGFPRRVPRDSGQVLVQRGTNMAFPLSAGAPYPRRALDPWTCVSTDLFAQLWGSWQVTLVDPAWPDEDGQVRMWDLLTAEFAVDAPPCDGR